MNLMRGMGGGRRGMGVAPVGVCAFFGGMAALPWLLRNWMEVLTPIAELFFGLLVVALIMRGIVFLLRRPW